MYLLHDAVHVVFVGHACQLQVDGNVFMNVRYGRHSLQQSRKYKLQDILPKILLVSG